MKKSVSNQDVTGVDDVLPVSLEQPQLSRRMGRESCKMGQAEAGQWIGSSALARGPWSQDRQPRRTAGEERMGCSSEGLGKPQAAENRRHGATRWRANERGGLTDGGRRISWEQGWRKSRPGLNHQSAGSGMYCSASQQINPHCGRGLWLSGKSWSRAVAWQVGTRCSFFVYLAPSQPLNPALHDDLSA